MAQDALIGRTFGTYRIEEFVARGGMGAVYRAWDTYIERTVALKVLAGPLAADDQLRKLFLRESQRTGNLEHPGIIPVWGAGEADGLLYLAMPFISGGDLGKLLMREGPLRVERALAILAQVADALDTAHDAGLVHRDVKPQNILIRGRGRDGVERVYLADFGIARKSDASSVLAGGFMGSYQYAAPEQFLANEPGPQTDIYALTCVLFECLTGRPPFAADSPMMAGYAHVNNDPPSAHALRSELPPGLDEVFRKGMAKAPAERYTSATALIEAARSTTGVGDGSPPAPPTPPDDEGAPTVPLPPEHQQMPEDEGAPTVPLAGLPRRIMAYTIDAVSILIVVFLVGVLGNVAAPVVVINPDFPNVDDLFVLNPAGVLIQGVALLLISGGYFVFTWTKPGMRASLGMGALGLQVGNDTDGTTLTKNQAVLRWALVFGPPTLATFASNVATSGELIGIGGPIVLASLVWVMVLLITTALSPTKQGLHDRYARTVVVKTARSVG
ncbi:hypothetical protein BH20CHL6_BH20CHL6_05080 [soil metagenome]